MVAVAAPTAATVAVPEMRYRTWKAVITGLSAAVLFGSILIVGPILGLEMDIMYIPLRLQHCLVGGIFGALVIILLSSYIRIVRPPEPLKGRSGAAVLSIGTIIILFSTILWAFMKRGCHFKNGSLEHCPLPMFFDHNATLCLAAIVANVLIAEGALRLMAAGTGMDGYVQI
eukprot:CAMPEP_0198726120 /NCGR_PEP_ID=MMETSP1475-20131203/3281_1 /TAXON_ID= ORGANISM="Unidentified sp., Strain CCMP1999" /NCGR_SAMPLE_ID=MMETSP1475 /ASSEMBLY_ACC=CAM_ASM_001111 /LENGTH=171 /DNA_ID=CAMNT_0044488015 /DNA_START=352 /DNA_END=867 /DNA_ORIENTATION=-